MELALAGAPRSLFKYPRSKLGFDQTGLFRPRAAAANLAWGKP